MPPEQIPLKLLTTTFCKAVLTEIGTAEHSLIGVLPAIQLVVQIPAAEKPNQLSLPFAPGLFAFVIFERMTTPEKPYEAEIEMRVTGPFPDQPPATSKLTFPADVRFAQMPVRFGNPIFQFNTDKAIQLAEIKVAWTSNGKSLGEAKLPIILKIAEQVGVSASQ